MIASASPMRWPELPEVPTIQESGWPVQIDSWIGLATPRGAPADVLAKLQQAALAAVADPVTRDSFEKLGVDPASLKGSEYAELLKQGHEEMGRMIRDANLPRIN